MSDIWLAVGGQNVVTVRLEPDKVYGRDLAGLPALHLPLQLQILPAGQNGDVQYSLVRLAGKLSNQALGEFARFEVDPMCEVPNPTAFFRQQEALVPLDRLQIRRFEDARAGDNAYFQITLSCLVWYPTGQRFEVTRSMGPLEVKVSKSDWAEKVVSKWNLSNQKIVEINCPSHWTGS